MSEKPMDDVLRALRERAKELTCLYRTDEILSAAPTADRAAIYRRVLEAIPPGWQFPESCRARIVVDGVTYEDAAGFPIVPWTMAADVRVEGEKIGEVAVAYVDEHPVADEGPFLAEERRLLAAIADRIAFSVTQRRLHRAIRSWESAVEGRPVHKWDVILHFLRATDRKRLLRITRRMINHLSVKGSEEAEHLRREFLLGVGESNREGADENRPQERRTLGNLADLVDRTFALAAREMQEDDILAMVQGWVNEDKTAFLYEKLENQDTPLSEVSDAIARYRAMNIPAEEVPISARRGLSVSLLRRFLSDRPDFISKAKHFVEVEDFFELSQHVVYAPRGLGKLGGKSAGLFLAKKVIEKCRDTEPALAAIQVPKTWYVASDALLQFIRFNQLEEAYNRKYRDIDQIRLEYPHLVQVFKGSPFPPEIVQGLAAALDDLEDRPIIVRSSSLLEDQSGAAFSGKYKSLFLANQGPKRERLAALLDAIAEVYASVFSPDPIGYRAERGLLDVHEEMGIMIQEVVGNRIGRWFLPTFAGVAFGRNEMRWSARIRREDGLVRLVPGLGTRAVDRTSDDYPILAAPGQPGLRVNVSVDEIVRYSPQKIDVIDLEANRFETVTARALFREAGNQLPGIRQLVGRLEGDHMRRPTGLHLDFEKDEYVVTFEGLFSETPFLSTIRRLLEVLEEKLGMPVDIELASDGRDLYILQCRPQSHGDDSAPAPIPRDIPRQQILFTADRYVSNGRISEITHVVYVDPAAYEALPDADAMKAVGRAVGHLNGLLPKRQFLLMGPGRWGSRGDIRLGVSVGYADISNAAMLIEIARAKDGSVPDVSFGTHFFQDLVETGIRYLPLYPDSPGIVFDDLFLTRSENLLSTLVPDHADLAAVVRVIDVRRETEGKILRVLLNADLDEAVAVFTEPGAARPVGEPRDRALLEPTTEEHWRWRLEMAQRIAAHIDRDRFGVRACYVIGSVKNATAGPASDIDLIVHFDGDAGQRASLLLWLDGWSQALAQANYLRTGYETGGLLDVHLVSDDDIAQKTSFAAKIGAVTDAARPLPLGGAASR